MSADARARSCFIGGQLDFSAYATGITKAVLTVKVFKAFLEANRGEMKLTLTFRDGMWNGGYAIEATGHLLRKTCSRVSDSMTLES